MIALNPANNQIQGVYGISYDANGNQNVGMYDVENRLMGAGVMQYAYDAQNRRIWSWNGATDPFGQGNASGYQIFVYSPSGQKLGAYSFSVALVRQSYTPTMEVALSSSDQYFGGRRLAVMDQLGSAGTTTSFTPAYFPWGEPRSGTGPQDTWNFATYWADSTTGLDYAMNRYYSNGYGRFMTADTSDSSAHSTAPQSWNRYAYVNGDPTNRIDPKGLDCIGLGEFVQPFMSEFGDDFSGGCNDPGLGDDGGGSGVPCVGSNPFEQNPDPTCPVPPAPVPPPPPSQPMPTCSISLYERSAGGSPGNHTYLDFSGTVDGRFTNVIIEGDPINKSHPPFRNPFSTGWPPLYGYVEPVGPGATYQGSTKPGGTPEEIDTGANICADFSILRSAINAYNSGALAPYMPIPRNGYYNSNSFTYTLLYDIGLENPSGSDVFPEPPGWNPGWGKLVPGLY